MTNDHDDLHDNDLNDEAAFEQTLSGLMHETASKARPSSDARASVVARAEQRSFGSAVAPRLAQVAAAVVLVGGVAFAATQGGDSGPGRTVVGTEISEIAEGAADSGQVERTAERIPTGESEPVSTTLTTMAPSAPPAAAEVATPTPVADLAEAYLVFAVHEFPNSEDREVFRKHHLYQADGGYRFAVERTDLVGPAAYVDDTFLTELLSIIDDQSLTNDQLRAAVLETLPATDSSLEDNRVWTQVLAVLDSGLATPTRQHNLDALVRTTEAGSVTKAKLDGTLVFQFSMPSLDDYVETTTIAADGTPLEFIGGVAGSPEVIVTYTVEPIYVVETFLSELGEQLPAQTTTTAAPPTTIPEAEAEPDPVDSSTVGGPSTDVVAFTSPTGNITCQVSADYGVWCHIDEKLWEIDQPEACVDGDYGNIVEVTESSPGFGCYTDLFWDIDADPLAYGTTASAGSFTCTIETIGVTCLNAGAEGFEVSRTTVRLIE